VQAAGGAVGRCACDAGRAAGMGVGLNRRRHGSRQHHERRQPHSYPPLPLALFLLHSRGEHSTTRRACLSSHFARTRNGVAFRPPYVNWLTNNVPLFCMLPLSLRRRAFRRTSARCRLSHRLHTGARHHLPRHAARGRTLARRLTRPPQPPRGTAYTLTTATALPNSYPLRMAHTRAAARTSYPPPPLPWDGVASFS